MIELVNEANEVSLRVDDAFEDIKSLEILEKLEARARVRNILRNRISERYVLRNRSRSEPRNLRWQRRMLKQRIRPKASSWPI